MASSAPLIFMQASLMTDEKYSQVFSDLELLHIPHRASHLPPIFKYKGEIHPHRKHRPQSSGNTYIYVLDTSIEGLGNAFQCGNIDKVPHKPKAELYSQGKYNLYMLQASILKSNSRASRAQGWRLDSVKITVQWGGSREGCIARFCAWEVSNKGICQNHKTALIGNSKGSIQSIKMECMDSSLQEHARASRDKVSCIWEHTI